MPRLEILLRGALLVSGGQAASLGVDAATFRRFVDGHFVPVIPATALRGAVRIQLESLLAGDNRKATPPYPLDEEGTKASTLVDPVAVLFGYSGKLDARSGSKDGCVRFSDAVPHDPDQASASLRVRTGVAIDEALASAQDQHLFFREVVELGADPLLYDADLDTSEVPKDLIPVLKAAVESTTALGAAKGRGGGEVEIRWIDAGTRENRSTVVGDPLTARRAHIALKLLEPAHLGDGGPRANHHGTRTHLPGATVRGAIAWALLRTGTADPNEEAFRSLFLGAAGFGDGLPSLGAIAAPRVAPATLGALRGGKGPHLRDRLALELARDRVRRSLGEGGLYLRADDGSQRFDDEPARPAGGILRRTRTRVSIDRVTGTAADQRLFSIEQIEPWLPGGEEGEAGRPLTFISRVEGLDPEHPEAAELLSRIAGRAVYVGAGRNHGLGRVEIEVRFDAENLDLAEARQRVAALAAEVERLSNGYLARVGLPKSEAEGRRPLALVAQAEYLPQNGDHPLAEIEGLNAPSPVRSFLRTGRSGGYDQRKDHRAPLKELRPTVGAGSVFVYEIDSAVLDELLACALPQLARGVGDLIQSGCGRFEVFEDLSTEEHKQ